MLAGSATVMSRSVAARVTPWAIEFFQRHVNDDVDETVPAQVFLDAVPERVAAKMVAVVKVLLAKHKYPPDKQASAVENVVKQAELFADFWVGA